MRRINRARQERMARKIERDLEAMRTKPLKYVYCLKENCPQAETCLHKLFFEGHKDKDRVIEVLNPYLQSEGNCVHYKTLGCTQMMAVGFMGQVCRMDDTTRKKFQSVCMKDICKTVYYEMRAGNRLLSPSDQSYIRKCATKVGWNFPANGFDQMYEVPVW